MVANWADMLGLMMAVATADPTAGMLVEHLVVSTAGPLEMKSVEQKVEMRVALSVVLTAARRVVRRAVLKVVLSEKN